MKTQCGCCGGADALFPLPTANRPGMSSLVYRVGTHATFLAAMKARLSNLSLEIHDHDLQHKQTKTKIYPLQDLQTRDEGDPAIALLDAWAIVADVLTFYQERIANEGYLRTAIERRSVLEIARLVDYHLRPGVASSVYLAYTLDDKSEPVEIPAGARAQSVPAPGELPQSFEASEPLQARREWNNLRPRMTQPQRITFDNALTFSTVYFDGTDTKLKPNDPLLFVFDDKQGKYILRRVQIVTPQFDDKRTQVSLQQIPSSAFKALRLMDRLITVILSIKTGGNARGIADKALKALKAAETIKQNIRLGSYPIDATAKDVSLLQVRLKRLIKGNFEDGSNKEVEEQLEKISRQLEGLTNVQPNLTPAKQPQTNFNTLLNSLFTRPSLQPANKLQLERSSRQTFSLKSDIRTQLLVNFHPPLAETLNPTLSNATISVAAPKLQAVFALRATVPLFGYNAPKITFDFSAATPKPLKQDDWIDPNIKHENGKQVFLDNAYDQIVASGNGKPSYVVINHLNKNSITIQLHKIAKATIRPRTDYGLSSKTTVLSLDNKWWNPSFVAVRNTIIYGQSEQLMLSEEPIAGDIRGDRIELGTLYDGLQAGRWIIISGERADIHGVSGVKVSELAMLAGVERSFKIAGDKFHTTLILAGRNKDDKPGLQYAYKRDTVTIYGNVLKAAHGETRNEVLGSGDATKPLQQFTLKQPPLTYVSAPTVEGIASTLVVRVNDVEWHETDSLAGLSPKDRKFITRTDDEAKTTIVFGNGREGARLPTGTENVKAIYRNGIGKVGNVKAEQISLLMTRPLGVKEVINLLSASGGADKESRDQARCNAPLVVTALDRLVSTQDYADFARTFAGIGKASATRLIDGHRQLVHITIAGIDDIPIDVTSDLYKNFRRAFHQFGDPYQSIQVEMRELVALIISATVRVLPDYQWETVEPKIRAALLTKFGFEQRELGQAVFLSEVIGAIQQVVGVAYTDVDVLDSISESEVINKAALEAKLKQAGNDQTVNAADDKQPRKYIPVALAQAAAQAGERELLSPGKSILPAQLAILLPGVPATLRLNPIEEVRV